MASLSLIRLLTICYLFVFSLATLADDSACCSNNPPPKADLSTPEKAVRYYWALQAWEKGVIKTETAKIRATTWEDAAPHMIHITTGPAKKYFAALRSPAPEVFDATIQSVSFENPDRSFVLVTIKNVTPIPKDATPTPDEIKKRARGSDFRYVLIRENTEWKLSEVWQMPTDFPLPPRMVFEYIPSNYPCEVWYHSPL